MIKKNKRKALNVFGIRKKCEAKFCMFTAKYKIPWGENYLFLCAEHKKILLDNLKNS